MTKQDRLTAVEISVKELCKTCELLYTDVKKINNNHLPTIEKKIEGVRTIAKSARFRAGVTLIGLAFIGLMIAILGVMVAVRGL